MNIVSLLPKSEYFSASQGGALATWAIKVYSRSYFNGSVEIRVMHRHSPDYYRVFKTVTCNSNYILDFCYSKLKNRSFKGCVEGLKVWLRQSYSRRAATLCRAVKPDIVHIQNDYEAIFPIRRLNPSTKIILHMQNDHLVDAWDLKKAEKAGQAADKIVFCSEYLRSNALKTFSSISPKKTLVILNGADRSSESGSFQFLPDDPCLLFVGRIVPQKGLHILLEALNSVFAHYSKATLRIVGGIKFGSQEEDEYLTSLRQKAFVWGDRITFVGPVPHDQVYVEFANADLFICPSVWNEPLGMVNAEAMACGLPIVAFDKGGIPEIVGDAGILVEETTPEALAQAINQVLGDPELYQTLSQRGLQRVREKFSWDVIAHQWLEELHKINIDN